MNPGLVFLALLLLSGPVLIVLGSINLRPNPFDKSIPPLEIITDRIMRRPDAPPRIKWHRRPARTRGWAAIALGVALFLAGAIGTFLFAADLGA